MTCSCGHEASQHDDGPMELCLEWGCDCDGFWEAAISDRFDVRDPVVIDPGQSGSFNPKTERLPEAKSAEEAVAVLRQALGMCVQVMLHEDLGGETPDDTRKAVRDEAMRTNLATYAFDPRFTEQDNKKKRTS